MDKISQSKSPLAQLADLQRESPKSCAAEDAPSWNTPRPSSVSSSSCTTDTLLERDDFNPSMTSQQHQKLVAQPICKQPLPGFQQAFGSTEIGKFSRSEFFASLVEAADTVSNDRSCSSPEIDDNGLVHQSQIGCTPTWHSPHAIGSET